MGCWERGVYKVRHNINKVRAEARTYGATGAALQWHDSNLCHPARESHLPDDRWLANTAAWGKQKSGGSVRLRQWKIAGTESKRECGCCMWTDICARFSLPLSSMRTWGRELLALIELILNKSNGFNMPLSLLLTTTVGLMSLWTRGLMSSCSKGC